MSDSSNITSRPWGSLASYTDAEWHEVWSSLFDGAEDRGPLLLSTDNDFLVEESATPAMTIQVNTGTAIVGGLWGQSESTETLTVAANGGGANRYDLVFLHWTRANQDLRVRIVDGTAATCATAVAPATNAIATYQTAGPPVTQWAVPLACITVVPGAVQILNASITDLREFSRFRTAAGDIADGVSIETAIVAGLTPAMTDAGAVLQIAAGGVGVDEISTAIAGTGIAGGGGAALSVDAADAVAGDALAGAAEVLSVTAGTGLEVVGDQLRMSTGATGDGLTGGGGAAMSVNVDGTTIQIAADTLSVGSDSLNHNDFTNRSNQRQFISAAEMHLAAGSGATWGTLAGMPVCAEGWLFPTAADNYVIFHAKVPIGYVATTPLPSALTFVWAHVNAGADKTCYWHMVYATTAGGPPWSYECGDSLSSTRSGSVLNTVRAADAGLRRCTVTSERLYYLETGEAYLDFQIGRGGTVDTYGASVLLLGVYIEAKRDM